MKYIILSPHFTVDVTETHRDLCTFLKGLRLKSGRFHPELTACIPSCYTNTTKKQDNILKVLINIS